MSSAILRCRMNFPVTKKDCGASKISDLQNIWHCNSKSSSDSSPPSSPAVKKHQNILAQLSLNAHAPTKKKLYTPPIIEKKIEKKKAIVVPPSLYSNITFSAKSVPKFREDLLMQYTFVYKGTLDDKENQVEAWNSFRKVLKHSKQSVVAGNNMHFHFADGKVTAKAKTSASQQMLKSISLEEPYVDEEKAINLIDSLVQTEKLSIFSTSCFSYGVATPISMKEVKIGSKDGDIYRVAFIGFMFPDFLENLEQAYANLNANKNAIVTY